ncbi:hypothetical protein BIW11_02743 [Tropilaelaps mercedesae]|uniref:Uncharacterized protein n=1 Tax=Tropilaelaps mercedesae TaxID=418985 RepID=A0A1V9XY33_9ACAR|nr:hypothetical protein BIW11_02743 [Tropilaelaps mercedesae]
MGLKHSVRRIKHIRTEPGETRAKRLLTETGETSVALESGFSISDLQPVEDTSSASPSSRGVRKKRRPKRPVSTETRSFEISDEKAVSPEEVFCISDIQPFEETSSQSPISPSIVGFEDSSTVKTSPARNNKEKAGSTPLANCITYLKAQNKWKKWCLLMAVSMIAILAIVGVFFMKDSKASGGVTQMGSTGFSDQSSLSSVEGTKDFMRGSRTSVRITDVDTTSTRVATSGSLKCTRGTRATLPKSTEYTPP